MKAVAGVDTSDVVLTAIASYFLHSIGFPESRIMKRNRLHAFLGGLASVAFAVGGILLPGCEALLRDPNAFFAENTCNIFNCDTLFFLNGEHEEAPAEHDESGPEVINE